METGGMVYKKNDIVRFVSEQPSAHIIRMFGHYQDLRPEDAEAKEYIGRIKSVVGEGRAYVVTTLSPWQGFICILNPDEIIGPVGLSELTDGEKDAYYERGDLDAPNVYDNDPSDLNPTWSVKRKCEVVGTKAMKALFPDAATKGFELFGCYDYRLEKYLADLDWCFANFADRQPEERKAELLRKKDELKSWFPKMRFKEYYTICIGVREDSVNPHNTYYWLIAVDLHFEEVCILRNTRERSRFHLFLGSEHRQLYEAKINYARECLE